MRRWAGNLLVLVLSPVVLLGMLELVGHAIFRKMDGLTAPRR
jgi:hypothetical protein